MINFFITNKPFIGILEKIGLDEVLIFSHCLNLGIMKRLGIRFGSFLFFLFLKIFLMSPFLLNNAFVLFQLAQEIEVWCQISRVGGLGHKRGLFG